MAGLPLKNYRVVDFGAAWAGPMAAQLLADLGAEVIKVESRERMDGLRLGRPIVGDDAAGGDRGLWPELQPVFHSINRNKLSVSLNLKTPEGLDLVKQLIARSDVVMNNYSPGVLARLGLDYPNLKKLQPDIILVSMPSVGDTGPLRDLLAYAPNIQALSGLMSLVGYGSDERDEEPLVGEFQSPWSDVIASLHAALGAAAALRHRNMTGEGQDVEVAQLEATASMLGEAFLGYQMSGEPPRPQGNADPEFAPHNNYRCADEGADEGADEERWVSIAVRTDAEWQGLCRAMGGPEWAMDDRFSSRQARQANLQALDENIAAWTRRRTAEEAAQVLREHGAAAMPVMNIEHQFLDPHLRERRAYESVNHPHLGTEWVYGMPWIFSETPGEIRTAAPLLGEHNQYILCGLLGLTQDQLQVLEAQQAVY